MRGLALSDLENGGAVDAAALGAGGAEGAADEAAAGEARARQAEPPPPPPPARVKLERDNEFDEHDVISALRALGAFATTGASTDEIAPTQQQQQQTASSAAPRVKRSKRANHSVPLPVGPQATTSGRVVKPSAKLRDASPPPPPARKRRVVAARGSAKKARRRPDPYGDDEDEDEDGEADNDDVSLDDDDDDNDNDNTNGDLLLGSDDVDTAAVHGGDAAHASTADFGAARLFNEGGAAAAAAAAASTTSVTNAAPARKKKKYTKRVPPPANVVAVPSTSTAAAAAVAAAAEAAAAAAAAAEAAKAALGSGTAVASLAAALPARGRRSMERERDFKAGPERRRHHVSATILAQPPTWSEAECAAFVLDIARRAAQRERQIEQLARDSTSDLGVVRALVATVSEDLGRLHAVCCACVLALPLLTSYFRAVVHLKRQAAQTDALAEACADRRSVFQLLLLGDLPAPPTIPFKGKPGQVPEYQVQLFVARGVDDADPRPQLAHCAVTATSHCAAKEFSKALSVLTNSTSTLGANQKATFLDIVVEESSRMEFVTINFALTKPQYLVPLCGSVSSPPMIVVTNESQWPGAAKRLLWHDTFVDESSIPWPLFANMLNMHMICGLQQSLDTATRPLYDWEMRYLHSNPRWFNNEKLVTREQALAFWNFFGAALTALRFKRHCLTMWSRALLLGFVSRDKAAALLAGEREGTFCLRFSESLPGAFAVAYVAGDTPRVVSGALHSDAADAISRVPVPGMPGLFTTVKHFLILPTQLGHNRTLPDFIRDKSEFRYICALKSPDSDAIAVVSDKDATLAPFYKQDRLEGKHFTGYVSFAN